MPESIIRKIGLISCGGEDLPEGTISRIAARLVLEELRPQYTVTLCLPLFLAGGEAERAFARPKRPIDRHKFTTNRQHRALAHSRFYPEIRTWRFTGVLDRGAAGHNT